MDWGGVSESTLSGGEYLDFPIEGNSIKNDGLNRLITVVTAFTYPYKKITIVSQVLFGGSRGCPCQVCRGGDEAARATDNEIRPQRTTAARARCVVGGGGGGMSASTLSK